MTIEIRNPTLREAVLDYARSKSEFIDRLEDFNADLRTIENLLVSTCITDPPMVIVEYDADHAIAFGLAREDDVKGKRSVQYALTAMNGKIVKQGRLREAPAAIRLFADECQVLRLLIEQAQGHIEAETRAAEDRRDSAKVATDA